MLSVLLNKTLPSLNDIVHLYVFLCTCLPFSDDDAQTDLLWFLQTSAMTSQRSRAMQNAIVAVRERLLTVTSAARLFGVSQPGLHYHIKNMGLLVTAPRGTQHSLTGPMKNRLEELLRQSHPWPLARCRRTPSLTSWPDANVQFTVATTL